MAMVLQIMIVVLPLCSASVKVLKSIGLREASTFIVMYGKSCRDRSLLDEVVSTGLGRNIRVIETFVDEDMVEEGAIKLVNDIKRVWRGERLLLIVSKEWRGCLIPILALSILPQSVREVCTILIDGRAIELSRIAYRERSRLSIAERKIVEYLESVGGCGRAKDMANTLEISRSTLYRSLSRLIRQGLVKRESRGIYCIERGL